MSHVFTEPQLLWLEALRSGKYTQTIGTLQDSKGFCCLGVACDVAEKASISVFKNGEGMLTGGELGCQKAVKDWLGLTSDFGSSRDGNASSLASVNDRYGYTFPQIAEYIEIHAEGFFVQPSKES